MLLLMKKLLGFIFISLFYCNLGFADVFLKNCSQQINPIMRIVRVMKKFQKLNKFKLCSFTQPLLSFVNYVEIIVQCVLELFLKDSNNFLFVTGA